jgi:hypothetical protein
VGNYVATFDNECALEQRACEEGKPFEKLEDQACEGL